MIVFDIDGTISNDEWRVGFAKQRKYNKYHSLSFYDMPVNGALGYFINKSKTNNIIFLTGRPEKWRAKTNTWLIIHLFYPYDKLIMRPDKNRNSTCSFKKAILIALGTSDIELFIDNDERNLIIANELGINTLNAKEMRSDK